ncbi:Gly-Xaa carboxypeptidase, partial [Tremellales sp. Uapishka_1]
MAEKTALDGALPLPSQTSVKPTQRSFISTLFNRLIMLGAFVYFTMGLFGKVDFFTEPTLSASESQWAKCPVQPRPLHPKLSWNMTVDEKTRSIDLFSQSVQIPTESFDDNGEPGDDPRWDTFIDFQGWLKRTFPLAWVIFWMSHYDVVPAPSSTFDRWTHPPFSGFNDGTYIWGRGAADDKTLLVAQWEAITHLLEAGFSPRRTLIFSHGFDEEEVFARRGQGQIAPFLEKRYGKDSLLMVIDEGSGSDDDFYGASFAVPGMGEKGYMDMTITVGTAGGHSSVPPAHSGIGIMSRVVSALEDHPFEPKLTPGSPLLTSLMCASKYSPSFPKSYSKLLSGGPRSWNRLAKIIGRRSRYDLATLGTTIAVDVIQGGVKINALPEVVTASVNFRIDYSESVQSTQTHVENLVSKIAKKFDLGFSGFGQDDKAHKSGKYISLELMGLPLEPAPRTPMDGGVWELFAGTVKAAIPGPEGQERIVTPFASTGNTDCKMYYGLTKNVYRFMGATANSGFFAHTVDERATIEAHLAIVQWVHAIIQNADEYTGEE